jgi:hypothetical protein
MVDKNVALGRQQINPVDFFVGKEKSDEGRGSFTGF